jgi:Zn-dependent protease with chaperone function
VNGAGNAPDADGATAQRADGLDAPRADDVNAPQAGDRPAPRAVRARYFDGRSSRPQAVRVTREADALLLSIIPPPGGTNASPEAPPIRVAVADVQWPERVRHGARIAHLPGGASLQADDVGAWDDWLDAQGRTDGWVVRAQQSWRGVAAALVLLLAVGTAGYLWGLPLAARAALTVVPERIDALVGEQALASIEGRMLQPSRLPAAEQARLRALFADAARRTWGPAAPAWQLEFRRGKEDETGKSTLGPNALALPGGTMILTDELVELVRDDAAVLGVLGHELGHVRHRHGMRQLLQVSALGAVASVAFGDYGTLISTAPVVLATLGYSRDAEREADEDAVRLLRAAGHSPLAMVRFFEALAPLRAKAGQGGADGFGLAFSSHPADAERIAFFRDAAAR